MSCMASFTIAELARRTGVNPVTLRAWERRYGLLRPERTAKGHRLYDEAAVEQVQAIVGWLEKGVAISRVRPLLEGVAPVPEDHADDLAQAAAAVEKGNVRRLEQALNGWLRGYPLGQVVEQRILPLLDRYRAEAASGSAAGEALLESFLIQKFGVRLLDAAPTVRQPGLAVSWLGPRLPMDGLLMAQLLRERGIRLQLYLSAPPARDLRHVMRSDALRALVLCIAPSLASSRVASSLRGGADRLGKPLMLVGAALPQAILRGQGWRTVEGSPVRQAEEVLHWLEEA